MIADRQITINRTRRVPFDVTNKATATPTPVAKPSVTPPAKTLAVSLVTPVPPVPQPAVTRFHHTTIAVLFFGSAWLVVVPPLVGLGWLGSGVAWLFAILMVVVLRDKAKRVRRYD